MVRPAIGPLLPVFVLDEYEGVEARRLQDMTRDDLRGVVEANAAAVRAELPADLVFVNHVLLGAAVGAAAGAPYVVKAHGSELEFSLRGNPALSAWARGVAGAGPGLVAGTEHVRRVLEEVVGPGDYLRRVEVVPPGVDVGWLRPEPRAEALAALIEEARLDPPNPADGTTSACPTRGTREVRVLPRGQRADRGLLRKAQPGEGRQPARRRARRGRGAGRHRRFRRGAGALEAEAAARGVEALFPGPLEHRHLRHLSPCRTRTSSRPCSRKHSAWWPRRAPRAVLRPIVARHSGLAEIAAGLEEEYPPEYRSLTSFTKGDTADLAGKLDTLLSLPPAEHRRLREAARGAAVAHWSWERIAALILSAGWETPSG